MPVNGERLSRLTKFVGLKLVALVRPRGWLRSSGGRYFVTVCCAVSFSSFSLQKWTGRWSLSLGEPAKAQCKEAVHRRVTCPSPWASLVVFLSAHVYTQTQSQLLPLKARKVRFGGKRNSRAGPGYGKRKGGKGGGGGVESVSVISARAQLPGLDWRCFI